MDNLSAAFLCLGVLAGDGTRSDSGLQERPQLVAFTASWCCPCKQQAPVVDAMEAAGITVIRIDIGQRPDLARRYGVTAVPTYFYYECNQMRWRTNQAHDVLMRIRSSMKSTSESVATTRSGPQVNVAAPEPAIKSELASDALEPTLAPRIAPSTSVVEVPIQVIVAGPR